MAAYALRCIPRIDAARKAGPVVVDGLYSWEEYIALTEHYGEAMVVAAVYAPPATRYARLGVRKIRPLTREQAFARDRAEIENINKGGPIAMADAMLLNTSTLEELRGQAEELARSLSGEIH
jgi:dephospho-CoA kinase